MEKKCVNCGELFKKSVNCSLKEWENRKYCSIVCKNKHLHKGRIPWNKGLNKSDERVKKYCFNSGNYKKGIKPHNFKGKNASYSAIHIWVKYHFGKADRCEKCGIKNKRIYHWHNISGKYLRERKDWEKLCPSCHKYKDIFKKTI